MLAVAFCLMSLAIVGALLANHTRDQQGGARIGGPFALMNQDGKPVTQADFEGHPFLVFFGFTHCPDVCPTTLSDMSRMLEALGKTTAVSALFITVDPARDTPAVLKDYLSSFDSRIVGLTGDAASITAAEKAYLVYAKQVPISGGDYSMDHTAIVYLMDRNGRFVNAFNLDQPPEAAAAELKRTL